MQVVILLVMEAEVEDNMIETIAPIPIEELKKYFTDKSISYVVDYDESKLKGAKLLTYISNLDMPIDVKMTSENRYELLEEYIKFPMILNCHSLEVLLIDVLLEAKGLHSGLHSDFISEHKEILDKWINKIESLTLYNMHTIKDEKFNQYVESYPKDDTDELDGINFVSLLKHKMTFRLFSKIDKTKLKNYTTYFTENMFKGTNLFSYWANKNNPMFLLTFSISNESLDHQKYFAARNKTIQELSNVSSI